MKIPEEIPLYGDLSYRDKKCPKESLEQITFISRVRREHPDTYGKIIIHPKNEGLLISGQFSGINKNKAMGQTKGASDIVIPGMPSFVCEIKRQDRTLSSISDEQIEYLLAAQQAGSFICIALGCDAAWEAFNDWIKLLDCKIIS